MDIVNRINQDFPEIARQMRAVPEQFAPGWLKDMARAMTGLEDFGPDDALGSFEDGLARLCVSLEDDANLNAYGRLLAAGMVRDALANRLLLQQARAEGKTNGPLLAPIIVTGLPRTGTTFLHRLLAADPAHASLPFWQVRRPIPNGPDDTADSRLANTREWLEVRRRLTPELDGIHLLRADQPEECMAMNAQSMVSRLFWNVAAVVNYQHWVSRADKSAKYADYADLLRYLQSEYPGKRLVLKAPEHNDGVRELLAALPDARVVITHRDMLEQIGSYLSLGRTMRLLGANAADTSRENETVLDMADVSLAKMAEARAAYPDRILDLRYTEIMADPLAEIERIYRFCGLTLPESRRATLAEHNAKNPKGKHGAHDYSLAEFGLDDTQVRVRYASYEKAFLS